MSGQCELCLNGESIRVFPCLYHCKKMLCIEHLAEHDRAIEKQIQLQKHLANLWMNFQGIFQENKVEEQLRILQIKLDNYRNIKEEIQSLLLVKHFHQSIEHQENFQRVIQTIENAIEQENENSSDCITPKIERDISYEEEEDRSNIDYGSLSSSGTTNEESQPITSSPTYSNENMPLDDEYFQEADQSEDQENCTEFDEINITPNRKIATSRIRGHCPLTCDGIYGISTHTHGIRLCPDRSQQIQRPTILSQHFRRVHHLTSFASLKLTRAIADGDDPMTTQLFTEKQIILNVDQLRSVNCPISKLFIHYPFLQIPKCPCQAIKQIRHLKYHLEHIHRFTSQAANIIIKYVKNDVSIHQIEFPRHIDILQKIPTDI